MSYLDDTGLAYFWTKIKAYVSSFLTWANIQNKPSTFAPSAHSHGNITDTGELGTASRAVVTDGNKKVSVSSVTSTELDYLSGVTSNVQTQLNGKAASSDIPTIPSLSRTISGSGNAITDITVSGHAITATKGSTFLTSHQTLPTLSLTTSGSGNAITALSVSNHAITATKETTFLTSHQSLTDYLNKTTTSDQYVAGEVFFDSHWCNMRNTNMYLNSNPTSSQNQGIWFGDHDNKSICRHLLYFNSGTGSRGYGIYLSKKGAATDYVSLFNSSLNTSTNKFTITIGSTDTISVQPDVAGITLGANSTSHRWGQIYSSSTSISTSDERVKTEINDVPEEVLNAWENINWYQFKMKDSVQEKGIDKARLHNGLIAQQIDTIFKNYNLDASKYGLFCYDEWETEEDVLDDENNIIELGQAGGNLYSVRYEEALCMEAAYMRRENARLKERLAALEERLAVLEMK